MQAHKHPITPDALETLQRWMAQHLGWSLRSDEPTIASRVERVCAELGTSDPEACIALLQRVGGEPRAVQAVAREFGVGESYFFRDRDFFSRLEEEVLPQLLAKPEKELRIWSVGCSRGEELYSVAMLLHRMLPDRTQWQLHLYGTDVNTELLERARKGVFGRWSFRQMPDAYLYRYFTPVDDGFEILPEIRRMARFEYHNIVAPDPFPLSFGACGFDLILLRNILIYLDETRVKQAAGYLFSRLREGGWLATTPAEYDPHRFDFGPHAKTVSASLICKERAQNAPAQSSWGGEEADLETPRADLPELPDTQQSVVAVEEKLAEKSADTCSCYARYSAALASLESGATEEAKRALRQCLYLESSFAEAHIALGSLLNKEGDRVAAMRHLERARAILTQKEPHEALVCSGGMRAKDLLALISSIKKEAR